MAPSILDMGNNDKGDTWQSDSGKGKGGSEKKFTIGKTDTVEKWSGDEGEEQCFGPVGIDGVFSKLAEAEDQLGVKAQSCLEKLPVGKAAELMDRVVSKGETIKNPDKYVTGAVSKIEKSIAAERARIEADVATKAGEKAAEEPAEVTEEI